MNATQRILEKRARRITKRLDAQNTTAQDKPVMSGTNIHYEICDRSGAIGCGGIAAIHLMAGQLGLVDDINQRLHLLKVHLPYHDSLMSTKSTECPVIAKAVVDAPLHLAPKVRHLKRNFDS